MKHTTICLLSLLAAGALSLLGFAAEEDVAEAQLPATPNAAAAALIELAQQDRHPELRRLAERLPLDPWLVADALCERGALDVAETYGQFAPETRSGGVGAFIAEQRTSPTPKRRRHALKEAAAASARRAPVEAVEIIDGAGSHGADVISVRLQAARAIYVGQTGDARAALNALLALVEQVREMNWPTREADLWEYTALEAERCRDFEAADVYWQNAARRFRSLPSARDEARVLSGQARLRFQQSRFGEALRTMRRALPLIVSQNDAHGVALAYSALGTYETAAGDLSAAIHAHEEALRVLEASADHDDYAVAASQAAKTLFRLSEYTAAVDMTTKALTRLPAVELPVSSWADARRESVRGALHLHRADALAQLRRLDEAKREVGSSIAAFRNARSREYLCSALAKRGELLLLQKDLPGAKEAFEHALEVAVQTQSKAAEIKARTALAIVAVHRSEYDQGLSLLRQAEARAAEIGDVHERSLCLHALAWVSREKGAYADALAFALGAIEIDAAQLRGLGTDETERRFSLGSSVWEIGIQAATRTGDLNAWFEIAESGRAHALAERLGGRGALQAAGVAGVLRTEADAMANRVVQATADVATAREAGRRKAIRAAAKNESEAKEQHRRLLDRIERRKKLAADLNAPQPPKLSELQARLGKARALALFHVGETASQALVVTAEEVRLVDLGPNEKFVAHCAAVRIDGIAKTKAVASAREAILQSLQLAEEIRTLLVVPDGPVATVPFALLEPRLDIAIVPSALVWTLLDQQRAERGAGVLALGNPDYSGRRMASLPATRNEVTAVGTRVLLGQEATEAALLDAILGSPRWRAVHFACHGVLDARHASLSGLALTRAGNDDGMLTAREILGWSIPADLAVLSACEAGRPGKAGESDVSPATGIPPAFLAAGCSRVIANLWKVDDQAARVFSVALHEAWGGKDVTASAALRTARDAVRSDPRFKEPRHWAGWVLWGLPD